LTASEKVSPTCHAVKLYTEAKRALWG
jgi:hypothetical protein